MLNENRKFFNKLNLGIISGFLALISIIKCDSVKFFGQFIKPGDLVFDVGAHTGVKTDLFLQCGARVNSGRYKAEWGLWGDIYAYSN